MDFLSSTLCQDRKPFCTTTFFALWRCSPTRGAEAAVAPAGTPLPALARVQTRFHPTSTTGCVCVAS